MSNVSDEDANLIILKNISTCDLQLGISARAVSRSSGRARHQDNPRHQHRVDEMGQLHPLIWSHLKPMPFLCNSRTITQDYCAWVIATSIFQLRLPVTFANADGAPISKSSKFEFQTSYRSQGSKPSGKRRSCELQERGIRTHEDIGSLQVEEEWDLPLFFLIFMKL